MEYGRNHYVVTEGCVHGLHNCRNHFKILGTIFVMWGKFQMY